MQFFLDQILHWLIFNYVACYFNLKFWTTCFFDLLYTHNIFNNYVYVMLKSTTLRFVKWLVSTECPFLLPMCLVLLLVKTRSTFGKFTTRINLLKMASLEPR